ncbi:MAG TPA: protein kinase [Gemmatimonadaceae bacterium]|nr:protein kinase [Gemmatimonadaceae bacterium]
MSTPADQLERIRSALASRYRLVRELGRGGMATVYLADDLKHDRQVAVKVLRSELAATLGTDRFLREIQIAAQLAHPHILPLYDSGEADGFLYYVMPFVEGETLRDRIDRERHLPISDSVRITREVADALHHAHLRGIVHRDIKPENILFLGGHAVVADFGVAAVGTAASGRLTESGVAVGTPLYMSPEQAAGETDLDARSDVYSLGIVTYEMLAGEPPFRGSNVQAVVARKLNEAPPRLSHLRASVPPMLEEAVRRALAREPVDRFADVAAFASAVELGADNDAPSLTAPQPKRLRTRAVIVAALAVLVIGAAFWTRQRADADSSAQEAGRRMTVAVLPFENLGPAENEYFPVGITDEIASRLGSVDGISVVSRRAAQRYVQPGMTMRDIGQKLGADVILAGSVRWDDRDGDTPNVRISLELLRVRDERQLWATTYDRVIDDIFEVQSSIAAEVVQRLGIGVSEHERSRLAVRPTTNHEAYTLYLKGRYFWNKRTEEDIQKALDHFQQAVDLDPSYSLAWSGIADAWIFRGWYSLLAPRETFPKARTAVLKALEFDSTLAEAHASLAHIHLEFDYDWESAEREYRRAIELNPRYPIAHHWYGGFLSAMGRHEEALAQADTARRLDPLSAIIQTWAGLRHYFARSYQPAIAEYRKALEMDRDFAPAHWHLGWVYEQTGDFANAVAEARAALAADTNNLVFVASLARAHALAGDGRRARTLLDQLSRASRDRHVSSYHIALVHLALGDRAAAMRWLDRAYEERSPWIAYLEVDPRVDPLREQRAFAGLLAKAKLGS